MEINVDTMTCYDTRPIGVFDSGLGGLTAVRELQRLLPNEDIIYFGDVARIPYGTRSSATIIKYARQDIRFLLSYNVKVMLAACGTVSTVAADLLCEEFDLPLVEVVSPSVRKAADVTRNGKIGLIATQASVTSGSYARKLACLNGDFCLIQAACPLLVPLVEAGRINCGDPVAQALVAEYLEPVINFGADTLILGCTHYPLLSSVITSVMGQEVTIVNSGQEAAHKCAELIDPNKPEHIGTTHYYVSDDVEGFSQKASLFLQKNVESCAKWVDLDLWV